MRKCPKLIDRTPEEIASFLTRKFQDEKVKYIVEDFAELGFTKESLLKNKNVLFQFLVLVSFDRRPFSPYEIVWDQNDPKSVVSTLKRKRLLELEEVKNLTEKELDKNLNGLKVKNLHLSYLDLAKKIKTSKTMKELANKIDHIHSQLKNLNSGYDVMKLHRMIDDIHGIGSTIAAKFVMYAIRCMGIGNVNLSELEIVARNLESEWRNSKWVKQLIDIGILEEIYEKLKEDPFAFDYFWDLDRYYCSPGKCKECEL